MYKQMKQTQTDQSIEARSKRMSCLRVTFFLAFGVFLVGYVYSDVMLFGEFNVEGATWFKLFAARACAFYIYLVSIALFVAALFNFNDAIRLGAS